MESVRNIYDQDKSEDAKLHIIENAIMLVDKNKTCLGKFKNMSSLEKNRIALNMLQSLKQKDKLYQFEKGRAIDRNLRHH